MKIGPVRAELFHAEGRRGVHDEADGHIAIWWTSL